MKTAATETDEPLRAKVRRFPAARREAQQTARTPGRRHAPTPRLLHASSTSHPRQDHGPPRVQAKPSRKCLASTLDRLFDRDETDIPRFDFRQAAMDLDAPSLLYLTGFSQAGKYMISQ